jgi:hypothetical protein
MYNRIAGLAAVSSLSMGLDLDEHIDVLNEALETATLPVDRARLRILRGVIEVTRGVNVQALSDDITEILGDSTDHERLFMIHMARSHTAQISGDLQTAFAEAMAAWELQPQNPEIPLSLALTTAIWAQNADQVRLAASRIDGLKGTGELIHAMRLWAEGAVAAVEGRRSEALAAFGESRAISLRLEQDFDAATLVVNAAQVMGDEPEVRSWAMEARPLLEAMGAKPWLERLDKALAGPGSVAPASAASSIEVRTGR